MLHPHGMYFFSFNWTDVEWQNLGSLFSCFICKIKWCTLHGKMHVSQCHNTACSTILYEATAELYCYSINTVLNFSNHNLLMKCREKLSVTVFVKLNWQFNNLWIKPANASTLGKQKEVLECITCKVKEHIPFKNVMRDQVGTKMASLLNWEIIIFFFFTHKTWLANNWTSPCHLGKLLWEGHHW